MEPVDNHDERLFNDGSSSPPTRKKIYNKNNINKKKNKKTFNQAEILEFLE